MKSKENEKVNAGIGIPSILLIFIVMCLMVFGALSLSTARNDRNLAYKNAEKSTEYYNAVGKSEELISLVDQKLADSMKSNPNDEKKLYSALKQSIDNKEISFVNENNEDIIKITVDVNESKALEIKLKPTLNENKRYTTISHKLIETKEWSADKNLEVFQG